MARCKPTNVRKAPGSARIQSHIYTYIYICIYRVSTYEYSYAGKPLTRRTHPGMARCRPTNARNAPGSASTSENAEWPLQRDTNSDSVCGPNAPPDKRGGGGGNRKKPSQNRSLVYIYYMYIRYIYIYEPSGAWRA